MVFLAVHRSSLLAGKWAGKDPVPIAPSGKWSLLSVTSPTWAGKDPVPKVAAWHGDTVPVIDSTGWWCAGKWAGKVPVPIAPSGKWSLLSVTSPTWAGKDPVPKVAAWHGDIVSVIDSTGWWCGTSMVGCISSSSDEFTVCTTDSAPDMGGQWTHCTGVQGKTRHRPKIFGQVFLIGILIRYITWLCGPWIF